MAKPYSIMDTDSPKKRRKKSIKQEKRLAKETGGKVQPGSGAVWSAKGDTKDAGHFLFDKNSFLHECKYTSHQSYRLSVSLWEEVLEKAFLEGRKPALEILLDEGRKNLRLIVLSVDDYLELRGDTDEQH